MDWFRLYHEFSTDPKVQMMPEAYQRRLVMLFCFRCNSETPLTDEEISFQLRIPSDEWASTKIEFVKRGFVDQSNNIINWNERQYISDGSNERVKKYREKRKGMGLTSNGYTKHSATVIKRDGGECVYCGSGENLCIDHALPVTLGGNDSIENLVTACKGCNSGKSGRTPDMAGYSFKNKGAEKTWREWLSRRVTVTVTPPDTEQTQIRTEDKEDTREDFEIFWQAYPKQRAGSREKAETAYLKAVNRSTPEEIHRGLLAYAGSDEVAKGFAKGAAAWLNDDRWTTDYTKGIKNAAHRPDRPGKSERAKNAILEGLGLSAEG